MSVFTNVEEAAQKLLRVRVPLISPTREQYIAAYPDEPYAVFGDDAKCPGCKAKLEHNHAHQFCHNCRHAIEWFCREQTMD